MANTQYPTLDKLKKPHVQLTALEKLYLKSLEAVSIYSGLPQERVHLYMVQVAQISDRENVVDD